MFLFFDFFVFDVAYLSNNVLIDKIICVYF
jgi:hypothetical protein